MFKNLVILGLLAPIWACSASSPAVAFGSVVPNLAPPDETATFQPLQRSAISDVSSAPEAPQNFADRWLMLDKKMGAAGGLGIAGVISGTPMLIYGSVATSLGVTYSPKLSEEHGYPVEYDHADAGVPLLITGASLLVVGIPLIIVDVTLKKKKKQSAFVPRLSPGGLSVEF